MTQTVEPITPAERTAEIAMSVERYHQLIEVGILTEDDRIELLENRIVEKMSKNPSHEFAKRRLKTLFDRLLPTGLLYLIENPIRLADSEPEPDGAVVVGTDQSYGDRHPGISEIALVIEVASSSLARDRGMKQRIYARAGIAAYWIVNLNDRVIEVYTAPQSDAAVPAYADRQDYAESDDVPVMIDGIQLGTIAVRDVLP